MPDLILADAKLLQLDLIHISDPSPLILWLGTSTMYLVLVSVDQAQGSRWLKRASKTIRCAPAAAFEQRHLLAPIQQSGEAAALPVSISSSSSSGPRAVEVNGGAGVVDTPDHNAITSSE